MTKRERAKLAYLGTLWPLGLPGGVALPNIYEIEGFVPNGCGPKIEGGGWLARWVAWIVPDRFLWMGIPSFAFEAIGDLHDYLYWLGGRARDRREADVLFYNLIRAAGKGYSRLTRCRLAKIAKVYFRAVRLGGGFFFNYRK